MRRIAFLLPACLMLACLLPWASTALADVAPNPLHEGRAPEGRAPTAIVMEVETVVIALGNDSCQITADFTLRHAGDAPETLQVGFPNNYPHDMRDVTVTDNGNRLSVKEDPVTTQYPVGPPGAPASAGQRMKTRTIHWLVWTMRFQPGETRRLTVRYRVTPQDNANYSTWHTRVRWEAREEFRTRGRPLPPAASALLEAIRSRSTGYLLRTGHHWAGPIGKAVIRVEHPRGAALLRDFSPRQQATPTARGLTWTLERFEPTEDVQVDFAASLTLDQELALAEAAAAETPDSLALQAHVRYLRDLRARLALP